MGSCLQSKTKNNQQWGQHGSAEDEVRAVAEAFNAAYATNDIEGYFDHYADGANVSFYGARQDIDGEWKIVSLHYTEIPPDE